MSRQDIVEDLVHWNGDIGVLTSKLREFPFDAEVPMATMRIDNITEALNRYLNGSVSAKDVEKWADAVEGRDDIEYAGGQEKTISELLSVLSNPEINGPLTLAAAMTLLAGLPKC